ncbi:MAG: lipopolysaccharide kinase InaA family protein [Muribaculaceae bacterium]
MIAPQYEHLREFIESIPHLPESSLGKVIYHIRNTVYRLTVDGEDMVIKSFKVPHLINRWAYAHLRPSKAQRAFTYALRLTNLGILTPQPIAYVCEYSHSLLQRSYLITQAVDATDADRLLSMGGEQRNKAIDAMARTLITLQQHHITHPDFNPRNVMLNSNYDAYLIDINRMHFGTAPNRNFFQHFKRIADDLPTTLLIAQRYAQLCGLNQQETQRIAQTQWLADHK